MTTSCPSIDIPLDNGEKISLPYYVKFQDQWGPWEIDEKVGLRFHTWASCHTKRRVYRIEETYDDTAGCRVSVQLWDPYTCQGCCFPRFSLICTPSQDIFWSRSTTTRVPIDFWKQKQPGTKKRALQTLFDVIFQEKAIERMEIKMLEDEEAAEILYEKLLNNSRITRLEFSNNFILEPGKVQPQARRPMDLCCNLVANSFTLKEVMIENLGKLSDNIAKKLFEAMQTNSSLEILDLRCSRYLESWYKSAPRYEIRDHPNNPVDIETLVSALLSSERPSSLQTLDLGGNRIRSPSAICSLAKELPNLGLNRLSLRGCSLTEDALVAIAKGLEGNQSLQELDLSHNAFTKPVMDQLTLSLQKNKFLRTLIIEHCSIDLDQVESLLSKRMSKITHLQHLHMDGNEFTWEPLSDKEESVGANLLVDALKENNSILTLKMGENGKIKKFGMVCCTAPPYSLILGLDRQKCLDDLSIRNEMIQEEYRRTRAQQAIVRISKLLLSKMVPFSDKL